MSFDLSDYVDVAERIRLFNEKYPEGSLQSELIAFQTDTGVLVGWRAKAWAYRTPDDQRPGIGHAYEEVPGKTPYTRDSEMMNAETHAWGRAIVAVGFETKKIASANEMLARTSAGASGTDGEQPRGSAPSPADTSQFKQPERKQPADGGQPEDVITPLGKHKGVRVGDLPAGYRSWVAGTFEAKNAEQRRWKEACVILVGGAPDPLPDDGIPF